MQYAFICLALWLFAAPPMAWASDINPIWRANVDAASANSVEYGGNGKTLLVAGVRGEITLWTVGEAKPRLRYLGSAPGILAARFADGGRTVAALGQWDRKLWRWQAATAAPLPAIDLGSVIGADELPIRFDVDDTGMLGFVASHVALHLIALDGRAPPRRIAAPEAERPLRGAALAPDGLSVCAIDAKSRIHCYRTGNGQLIASLTYELDEGLQSVALSRDGGLAAGNAKGYIARWKSATGGFIGTAGPGEIASPANAVATFPSRVFVAVGRYDGRIFVFSPDLANRAPIIELLGAKSPVKMIAINAAGQLAAAAGQELVVWDVATELARRGAKP